MDGASGAICLPLFFMGDKAYKQRKRAKGLCEVCIEDALPGKRYCTTHQQKLNQRRERYRQRNKYIRCTRCKNKLDEDMDKGYTKCLNCREELIPPKDIREGLCKF